MAVDPLIRLSDLTINLATSAGFKKLVRNSELELHPQKSVGLVGESGSGKTLTVSSILGIISFLPGITAGNLYFNFDEHEKDIWFDAPFRNNRNVAEARSVYVRNRYHSWQRKLTARMKIYRGKKIGIIFQRAKASLNPYLKIKTQISESLRMAKVEGGTERIIAWLVDCGFDISETRQIMEQYPHQLSGGQAQRAVMAVALSAQAETIIADEPTTGLDTKLQVETLVFMKQLLDKYKRSAIIISHNLQSVAKFTDICYVMYKGLTVEKGPTSTILQQGQPNHPYTRQLQGEIEATGRIGQQGAISIEGCPFYPNCQIYDKESADFKKRCQNIEPPRVIIEKDHFVRCWAFEQY
jgi:ABC-type dipeptide/oligopeptide/nickel transport system ATPase component